MGEGAPSHGTRPARRLHSRGCHEPAWGAGTGHALHVRTRRPGRSPQTAQLPRRTSTHGAPPAGHHSRGPAPGRNRPPRDFVRRRPRLPPLATDAPRPQRSGRGLGPGEERGAGQTGAVHYLSLIHISEPTRPY